MSVHIKEDRDAANGALCVWNGQAEEPSKAVCRRKRVRPNIYGFNANAFAPAERSVPVPHSSPPTIAIAGMIVRITTHAILNVSRGKI